MNKSKVAVILATYNPGDFLWVQIESIFAQKNVEVSIFIYDDESENQEDIFRKIKSRYESQNILIKSMPQSQSPGRNFLRAIQDINVASFDWVAFSDQDDFWKPEKLSMAIDSLLKSESDGYSSNLRLWDGQNEIGTLKKDFIQREFDHCFQGASAGCTYVVSKKLFLILQSCLANVEIMKVSNKVSHDWAIYYICRNSGLKWVMDGAAYILYRQHNDNAYGAKRGLIKKLRMTFGEWYSDNVFFMSSLSKMSPIIDVDGEINISQSYFSKLRCIKKIFEFRRKKLESVVAYFWWLINKGE